MKFPYRQGEHLNSEITQDCKKLVWITAKDFGMRHISETLSQTKCILFMEEEQKRKEKKLDSLVSILGNMFFNFLGGVL